MSPWRLTPSVRISLPYPLNTLAQTGKPAAMARVGLNPGETGASSGQALLLLFLGGLFGLLFASRFLLCCFLLRSFLCGSFLTSLLSHKVTSFLRKNPTLCFGAVKEIFTAQDCPRGLFAASLAKKWHVRAPCTTQSSVHRDRCHRVSRSRASHSPTLANAPSSVAAHRGDR